MTFEQPDYVDKAIKLLGRFQSIKPDRTRQKRVGGPFIHQRNLRNLKKRVSLGTLRKCNAAS